jgi:hypothetical protein
VSDHTRHETAVDRAVREAAERGAFDDLPGRGKPLPQLADGSEDWWLRGWLRREGISSEVLLPPSVQLRKELDRLPGTLAGLRSEREVRDAVAELNLRVVEYLRYPSGPRVPVRRVDADAAVDRWRTDREPPPAARPPDAPPPAPPTPEVRTRWWRRR